MAYPYVNPYAAQLGATAPAWPQYQPPQQAAQPVNAVVQVTGIEGAKAYQLPPNSSVPLFDGTDDVLYLKTTDGAGFPTIRVFRFEEVAQGAQPQAVGVTREEFDALASKVAELAGAMPRA